MSHTAAFAKGSLVVDVLPCYLETSLYIHITNFLKGHSVKRE